MEQNDLLKRARDLAARCERKGCLTNTAFLTPAECFELEKHASAGSLGRMVLTGGVPGCERKAAFFLPDGMAEEDLDIEETIRAVKIKSYFGAPGHRDYLGAILGLGIERDRIGDLLLTDDTVIVLCMASVTPVLLGELERVGKISVKAAPIALCEVTIPEKKVKKLSFTVKSLRLDAVTGDLFGTSRTAAAELIRLGLVTLNYSLCQKTDASVKEGDVLSVRGKGKGRIARVGGRSKKDRLFIEAELFL